MGTETSILSVLPNLGIGTISIGVMYLITTKFLEELKQRAAAHEKAMLERETALRNVELWVRSELSNIVSESTKVLMENTKIFAEVIRSLDKK